MLIIWGDKMAYKNQCGTCLEFKDCRDYKTLFDEKTSWAYREKGYCEVYKCCYLQQLFL